MVSDVLVVYPHKSSFIDQDIRILQTGFEVSTLEYRQRRDRFRLVQALRRTRVAIAWFVLGYAYAMVRFRRLHGAKCIMIPGGWDVESLPEMQYGEMQSRKRAHRTAYTLTAADRVLAVSEFTLGRVLQWAPAAPVDVLYHGFDSNVFSPGQDERKGVITVSRVSPDTWRLKGLSVVLEVARRLKDVPFTIVGNVELPNDVLATAPRNVRFAGFLPQKGLISLYRSARAYIQLSAVESFGCSLAEAMLCGCVPVVTDRGALPEVVGAVGAKVQYGDIDATVRAIENALESDASGAARQRILTKFPLETRRQRLEMEVRNLLDSRG